MVREAIASVLAQRDANFELIVVDDGSIDGTSRRSRASMTWTVARTEHRGPAAARNHGVEIAHAPLIAFLDSDDLWAPDKLRRQLAFHARNFLIARFRRPPRFGFAMDAA